MRSTPETLELDLSLRQSRSIYVALALIILPFAGGGLLNAVSAIGAMLSTGSVSAGAVLYLVVGAALVGAEYMVISQVFEANRRLKVLREDPEQKVRKLHAPFQASIFGPYH